MVKSGACQLYTGFSQIHSENNTVEQTQGDNVCTTAIKLTEHFHSKYILLRLIQIRSGNPKARRFTYERFILLATRALSIR